MTIIDSLILGIVEGFTEFLPISSTAHLTLASHILGLDQSDFVKTYEIAIQSGAMFAVLAVFWKRFTDMDVLKRVFAAFLPTAVIGFVLYELIKEKLIGNMNVILFALAIGGLVLIIFEMYANRASRVSLAGRTERVGSDGHVGEEGMEEQVQEHPRDEIKSLGYGRAALIGTVQAVAVIPGVSRSAATIIGGLIAGMSRTAVVEFSFLLAVPTILAATVFDVAKNASAFTSDQVSLLLVGFTAAFITALLGIKFLLSYVRSRSFIGFGVYRIAIVVVFLLIFA